MMKLPDILSLSTRMFKTRPMRTFLTVLGVGVGIGTVLFLVSLGYGLQNVILDRIATADSLLTLDVNAGPADELALTEEVATALAAHPDIAEVSRQRTYGAQFTMDSITSNGQISAVDHSFLRLRGVKPIAGSAYAEHAERHALISSAGAKLFNRTPAEMVGTALQVSIAFPVGNGSEVVLKEMSGAVTITGVVDDDNLSYLTMPLASISGSTISTYDVLKVKVRSNDVMEPMRQHIIDQGYVVSALSDTIDQANKVFRIIQIVLALFGFVALIVSAIGMFNTMTIALLERTNEIGIMRAIGVRRTDLRILFLMESMLMGFLGGLGGVLIGWGAGKIANIAINSLAKRFGGSSLDLFQSPVWFVGVIIIFSTVIGFLTGVYPSRRASRLNPLDALRYK